MQGRAVALVAGLLIAASAAAQLATQKSTQNGVTVAATPAHVVADASVWIFNIVLDTHSQYLSDDLAALEPFPRTVELRIKRAGEAHPRTFLWQLR